jgi:hypothetical protein
MVKKIVFESDDDCDPESTDIVATGLFNDVYYYTILYTVNIFQFSHKKYYIV